MKVTVVEPPQAGGAPVLLLVKTPLQPPLPLAEAKKADLTVNLVSGEEAEKIVSGLFKLDPTLVTKLKDMLYD